MPSITIGIVGDDLVVGDFPIPRAAETLGELMRRLQPVGHRAHRHPARRRQPTRLSAWSPASRAARPARTRCSQAAPRPRRPHRGGGAHRGRRRHGDVPATLRRRVERGRRAVGERRRRGQARRGRRAQPRRLAGPGGGAEPHGAAGADRAQELRQLHLHPHGERVDSHDGPGARPRHRRRRCCASSAWPR